MVRPVNYIPWLRMRRELSATRRLSYVPVDLAKAGYDMPHPCILVPVDFARV